jgi:hypothetical protein
MASIVVAGDTSGTVTLTAPLVAGTTTLTLPTVNGTVLTNASSVARSQLPAGTVLQVVQTSLSAYSSYTSSDTNAFVDVTGWNATITPTSASSRILVMMSTCVQNERCFLRMVRGSTAIAIGDASGSAERATIANTVLGGTSMSYQFVDSPATTSPTTYKIQIGGESGKTFLIGVLTNATADSGAVVPNTLILMEIA